MRPRTLPRPRRSTAGAALLALLTACGGREPPAPAAGGVRPALVEHDFGSIPHGALRQHDFALEIPGGGAGYVPETFQTSCSCARWTFWIRGAGGDGELRRVDHLQRAFKVLQQDETLVMRLTVDTTMKEPVDHPKVTIRGAVRLRDAASKLPPVHLPVAFRFAIAARIEVRPVAHVNFGDLPLARTYEETLELHPKEPSTTLDLAAVTTTDERVAAVARRAPAGDGGLRLVDIRVVPDRGIGPGPLRAKVRIPTNLDGYVLEIAVSGTITPDIVIKPFGHLSFGSFDLADPAAVRPQSALVTDHDTTRPAAFEVYSITDGHGASLADNFEVRWQELSEMPRSRRLFLHYKGGLSGSGFRGEIKLAKAGSGPLATITFVGFQSR